MKNLKIIIILLIGLMFFGIANSCSVKPGKNIKRHQKTSASAFINKLDELGYYKYTDERLIGILKNHLFENYYPNSEFVPYWDENTGFPPDFRYYSCDGETVYEEGGFTELLEQVKPTFNKIGLKINVTDHFEEWDNKNKWLNHRITINGTEYIIFKNFKDYGWGEAVMRFTQIINQEIENQGIKEKVYLVSGANDGRLIFLTQELYDYIDSVYRDEQWKPLEVTQWMKVMGVKPMKLN